MDVCSILLVCSSHDGQVSHARSLISLLDACACRQVHDRMTEQVYLEPLRSFATSVTPGPVFTIPVLEKGRAALEQINEELGLAFDEQDLVYYIRMFQDEMKRDPTNVELFDIAQSNSEHRCLPYSYPLGLEEHSMQKGPTLHCAASNQTTAFKCMAAYDCYSWSCGAPPHCCVASVLNTALCLGPEHAENLRNTSRSLASCFIWHVQRTSRQMMSRGYCGRSRT